MIKIAYLALGSISLLDDNPKKHDIEKLIESFARYGFRDAPILDGAVNQVTAGNGRVLALREMKKRALPAPLGILEKEGEWFVPVQTGIVSQTIGEAFSFAVDHNNITLMGGTFDVQEIASLWTPDYVKFLANLAADGTSPVSVQPDDLDILLHARGFIPTHESRPLPDYSEYRDIVIVARSLEDFQQVIQQIHQLVEAHPSWQAKVL